MIELYKPKVEDLWFREKMLSDKETMSYNHAYSGTIPFPKEKWADWYNRWIINHENKRFYRYIKEKDTFLGEVAYHFDEDRKIYVADVIIYAPYRKRGYGQKALLLLCEIAKKNGLQELYDDIAIDNPAIALFLGCGFTEVLRTSESVLVKKDLAGNLMRGELVTLEPLDIEKHAKGYFEVSQDEKIHEYVGNTVPETVDEVVDLLQVYEKFFINWMILSNETNKVIGIMRLSKPQIENGVLVATESQRLSSQYWRKGHMKEAKKLFYTYVFDELAVDILYADVWEGNTNSIKSLESYGYKLIETTNEIFSKTGEYTEKYLYSLVKNDWRELCGHY